MADHFPPFTPTEGQRDNLLILAEVLASPERRRALAPNIGFDMHAFTRVGECGTVACACGWGPIAGIALTPDEAPRDGPIGWHSYAARVFGANPFDPQSPFMFLFAASWSVYDNSPEGAAARIRWATSGKPIPYDWRARSADIVQEYRELMR